MMSRSKRKRPFIPVTTATSEKEEKTAANRKVRRINRTILSQTEDDEKVLDRKAVTDPWTFSKDGKRRVDPRDDSQHLRK
jgi:hypothetical protein